MEFLLLLSLCVVLSTVAVTEGNTGGPPSFGCVSMFPRGYGVDAETSDPPYELTISHDHVPLGENVTVTLKVKDNEGPPFDGFNGLFMQARMANCMSDLPIGMFVVPSNDQDLKVFDCHSERPKSAVSLKDNAMKTSVTLTWTAPISEPGRIYFRATVVYNVTTFWTNVFSEYLEDGTDNSTVPEKYCEVQTKDSASSLAAVTSLLVAAVVTSVQFF